LTFKELAMLFKIVLDGVQHITKSTWSSISCRLHV